MSHGLDLFNETEQAYAAAMEKEAKHAAQTDNQRRAELKAIVELSKTAGWAVFASNLKTLVNHELQRAHSTTNPHEAAVHLGATKLGMALMGWMDGQLALAEQEFKSR